MNHIMPCGNTQAEIDRDHNQYARERSIEHIEATNALRERKREMVEALLKNNYYTVGKNTYTLRDAIECIQTDEFWDARPFDNVFSINHLFSEYEDENYIQDQYVNGNLPQFRALIHSHVVSLVDMVLGE